MKQHKGIRHVYTVLVHTLFYFVLRNIALWQQLYCATRATMCIYSVIHPHLFILSAELMWGQALSSHAHTQRHARAHPSVSQFGVMSEQCPLSTSAVKREQGPSRRGFSHASCVNSVRRSGEWPDALATCRLFDLAGPTRSSSAEGKQVSCLSSLCPGGKVVSIWLHAGLRSGFKLSRKRTSIAVQTFFKMFGASRIEMWRTLKERVAKLST